MANEIALMVVILMFGDHHRHHGAGRPGLQMEMFSRVPGLGSAPRAP